MLRRTSSDVDRRQPSCRARPAPRRRADCRCPVPDRRGPGRVPGRALCRLRAVGAWSYLVEVEPRLSERRDDRVRLGFDRRHRCRERWPRRSPAEHWSAALLRPVDENVDQDLATKMTHGQRRRGRPRVAAMFRCERGRASDSTSGRPASVAIVVDGPTTRTSASARAPRARMPSGRRPDHRWAQVSGVAANRESTRAAIRELVDGRRTAVPAASQATPALSWPPLQSRRRASRSTTSSCSRPLVAIAPGPCGPARAVEVGEPAAGLGDDRRRARPCRAAPVRARRRCRPRPRRPACSSRSRRRRGSASSRASGRRTAGRDRSRPSRRCERVRQRRVLDARRPPRPAARRRPAAGCGR